MRSPSQCIHDPKFQKAIGGYPRGLIVKRDGMFFVSMIDDNMSEPDAESILWNPVDAIA